MNKICPCKETANLSLFKLLDKKVFICKWCVYLGGNLNNAEFYKDNEIKNKNSVSIICLKCKFVNANL